MSFYLKYILFYSPICENIITDKNTFNNILLLKIIILYHLLVASISPCVILTPLFNSYNLKIFFSKLETQTLKCLSLCTVSVSWMLCVVQSCFCVSFVDVFHS